MKKRSAKPKTTQAARRFRSQLRRVRILYRRAYTILTRAATALPEYVPLAGPTSERAAASLRARAALKLADAEAAQAERSAESSGTPVRKNPVTKTESTTKTVVDGQVKATSHATRTTTTPPKEKKPRRAKPSKTARRTTAKKGVRPEPAPKRAQKLATPRKKNPGKAKRRRR